MLYSYPEIEEKKWTGRRIEASTKPEGFDKRAICHNDTTNDYTARTAREDLEQAIEEGCTRQNGAPQCTYAFEYKPYKLWDIYREGDLF